VQYLWLLLVDAPSQFVMRWLAYGSAVQVAWLRFFACQLQATATSTAILRLSTNRSLFTFVLGQLDKIDRAVCQSLMMVESWLTRFV
jgi:hypothetical protein